MTTEHGNSLNGLVFTVYLVILLKLKGCMALFLSPLQPFPFPPHILGLNISWDVGRQRFPEVWAKIKRECKEMEIEWLK